MSTDTNWRPLEGSQALRLTSFTLVALFVSGCPRPALPPAMPPATAMAIAVKQEKKDETVLSAAERIDKNNAEAPASPQQPLIAQDVQVIKDAVAAAPALDLRPVTAAIESLSKEIASTRKENSELKAQLLEAKDSVWRQVQFWISVSLYGGAVAALILAVLRAKAAVSTGLDIVGGIKSAAFLLSLSATLFSVARFVAAWWFPWACGGIVTLTLGYVGYLVWQQQRAEQFKRALKPVVATLDAQYDEASEQTRKDLDATIFAKLSEEMKKIPGAKNAIHNLRAEGLSP